MKILGFLIYPFIFFASSNTLLCQHHIEIKGGVPLAYGQNTLGQAYSFQTSYVYTPGNKSGFGIGLGYTNSDLPEDGFLFTYDRRSIKFFALYNYKINVNQHLSISPETRLGYAFTQGHLNQIGDFSFSESDLMIGINTDLAYRFVENLEALVEIGFSHVFWEYLIPEEFSIPAVYIPGNNHAASFFHFNIGVRYNLGS